MRLRLAPLLALLVAAGCAAFGDDGARSPVTRGQLGTMVVPHAELGAEFAGLELDASASGPQTAADAADGTIEPDDTAKSMKRAGWLQGYRLDFVDRKMLASSRREGLVGVSTSVDLFADESSARAVASNEIHAAYALRGEKRNGAKYVGAEEFDSDVGDEAWGIGLSARVGKVGYYVTGILFRRGRIVGSAAIVRSDDAIGRTSAMRLARVLDSRIESVLAGELKVKPALETIDPQPLTLRGRDVRGLSTSLVGEAYSTRRVFFREFDVVGGRLGGSKIMYLRTLTRVFDSERAAAGHRRELATARGSRSFARRFLRSYLRRARFGPKNLEAHPLPWRGRDVVGVDFAFDAPKGRVEGVFLVVQGGSVLGSVTVLGFAQKLDAADILRLRGDLRESLRA